MDDVIDYLAAYLIGSIQTGRLLSKIVKGKTRAGRVVLILNLFKGAIPVFLAHQLSPNDPPDMVAAGFLAILGDEFPVYTRFKGTRSFWVIVGVFAAILYCMLVK